eukprot:GHVU01070802.1.p3 GENE.GHVU01070802.1~~GHVU01070802.1.p3  ORF type:complete len:132 (+),score=21.90 GHVU01070802.1:521-916(+)
MLAARAREGDASQTTVSTQEAYCGGGGGGGEPRENAPQLSAAALERTTTSTTETTAASSPATGDVSSSPSAVVASSAPGQGSDGMPTGRPEILPSLEGLSAQQLQEFLTAIDKEEYGGGSVAMLARKGMSG